MIFKNKAVVSDNIPYNFFKKQQYIQITLHIASSKDGIPFDEVEGKTVIMIVII